MKRCTLAALSGLLAFLAAGCARQDNSAAGAGENWLSVGGGADESGYSRLEAIDTGNVGELGLAWSYELPGEAALEATPLAVDGVLYFTGTHATVYAVDGATGMLVWRYDPETWKHSPEKMRIGAAINRGLAYADGLLFVGAYDGRLIALDAATGKPVWSVQTLPPGTRHMIGGAPRTFRGKVIIGNGGADYGARGFVTAYDAATGKLAWRFHTVPGSPEENRGDPAMERAARTWSEDFWKRSGGGGTVWNGITFDPELGRIYIGTGNSGPYDPEVRSPGGGDNLYLTSIVALDADSGQYVWHYQINPREAWDYKATANMITATLEIEGQPRKVLMQAPTNGFFYVLDRETGKPVSAEKIGKVTWAERIDLETGRPVEAPNIRHETGDTTMFPGMLGAHNWQAMSFSPMTGLVYIPTMQIGTRYIKRPGAASPFNLEFRTVVEEPEDGKGALLAWDPVAQKARWKVQHDFMWNGGTLATAGGLVFQGAADGWFSAYDAETGKRLWRFNAGNGIVAAPMGYGVDGTQYVSVLVGYGGFVASFADVTNIGWKYRHPRRLLTFKLGGTAKLAPSPPRSMKVEALDDPGLKLNEADVQAGARQYLQCGVCHGPQLRSPGAPAPDLRESQIALRDEDLWSVVHDGTLLSRGMPRFEELSREQVRQIHAYIRAGAREALDLRKPEAR